MESIGTSTSSNIPKWQNPEKWAGRLILVGLVATGFYYWGKILPFLIDTLQNTLHFAVLSGVVALLVIIFSDKKFRLGISYLIKMMLRKTVGLIIEIDPIAIMEISVEDAKDKRKQLNSQIDTLSGTKGKLDKRIVDNNDQIKQKFSEANEARRQNKGPAAELALFEAGGLREINDKLIPLQTNMKNIIAFFERVYSSSDFAIKKMEVTIKQKKMEYEIVKESYSAMSTAMSLFKGDPDKAYMFEQSVNYIADDMGKKLGEMKRAMELSTEFLDTIDIQKGVCSEKGLRILEEYNSGKLSMLAEDSNGIKNPIHIQRDSQRVPETSKTYNNLLD